MSAIAGIIRSDGCPVERATLERMQALLTPYGKDAQNHYYLGSSAFLRTLLRTTPEDRLDHQPLIDKASGTTLVFDGRLDNREEVASALGIPQATAMQLADSDLVMQACLRWDNHAVGHMLGDFALACWQPARRRLWLARDPLGMRPLFWHQCRGRFAFATMPKALFALPGVTKVLCEERLHDYLCLLPMVGPESFFKNIYRVEPGHWIEVEGDRVTPQRYHRFDPRKEIQLPRDEDYVEAFREQVERAVACRLRAIGPVASELSSGFDSSTVTALAAQALASCNHGLLAYTAVPREGFNGPVPRGRHADETPGARALAASFPNIEHIVMQTDGINPINDLQEQVERLDRAPMNLCNSGWINAIRSDASKRGSRVLLNGGFGNLTISYDGTTYLPALLGQGKWLALSRELKAIRHRYPMVRWRRLLKHCISPYVPLPLWRAFESYRGRSLDLTQYTAIHPAFLSRMSQRRRTKAAGQYLNQRPWSSGRRRRITALSLVDMGEYNAEINMMGMELRDPTADVRLIELCLALPESQYFNNGETSWLLRRLMKGVLPVEILESKTRGLQAADWYEGMGQSLPELYEELRMLDMHPSASHYLDVEALKKALDGWPEDGWETRATQHTYRLKLLRGVAVGAFIRYCEDSNL